MYADTIADAYETPALVASTSAPTLRTSSDSMDVDMVDSSVAAAPAGPRRGGGGGAAFSGRGGRGGISSRGGAIGLTGRVVQPQAQQPQPAAPVSLLDRVNGGGGGGSKTPTGTKSLAERLGQTGSSNAVNGQGRGKGNSKPTNGAATGGGGGGSSLLSRLH